MTCDSTQAKKRRGVGTSRSRLLFFVIGFACLPLAPAFAGDAPKRVPALKQIEGTWWSSCDAPAAEFNVQGDQYSGDFAGTHRLDLDGDLLRFHDGWVGVQADGAIGKPTVFRIITATGKRLVLRAVTRSASDEDWALRTCEPDEAR